MEKEMANYELAVIHFPIVMVISKSSVVDMLSQIYYYWILPIIVYRIQNGKSIGLEETSEISIAFVNLIGI